MLDLSELGSAWFGLVKLGYDSLVRSGHVRLRWI